MQEMGRELVDMWTAAASRVDMCLDTRGDFLFFYFKAIYLSLAADSRLCHEERQVSSAGWISFLKKKKKEEIYSHQTDLSALRFPLGTSLAQRNK